MRQLLPISSAVILTTEEHQLTLTSRARIRHVGHVIRLPAGCWRPVRAMAASYGRASLPRSIPSPRQFDGGSTCRASFIQTLSL